MKHFNRSMVTACSVFFCSLVGGANTATAAENFAGEYLTVESYIERARPYLHFSCEGAWNSVKPDQQAYIDIVNKIGAIGFINHDVDVSKLEALPEPELQALRIDYYDEIGRLCRENPSNLLAGVIERALLDAFSRLDAEGGQQ